MGVLLASHQDNATWQEAFGRHGLALFESVIEAGVVAELKQKLATAIEKEGALRRPTTIATKWCAALIMMMRFLKSPRLMFLHWSMHCSARTAFLITTATPAWPQVRVFFLAIFMWSATIHRATSKVLV